MLVVYAIAAICLSAPVSGPVVAGFAPAGQYAGHWGVDYSSQVGAEVKAPATGVVTFAGSVAGMRTVTIEPVPGFKVSVSYLTEVRTATGRRVRRGQVVGIAGAPHGVPGVHMSTRIDGVYVDPAALLGCPDTDISRALRLITPRQGPARRRLSTRRRGRLRNTNPGLLAPDTALIRSSSLFGRGISTLGSCAPAFSEGPSTRSTSPTSIPRSALSTSWTSIVC